MKSKFTRYILVASISFNIAFIGMGIYKKFLSVKTDGLKQKTDTYSFKFSREKQKKMEDIISEFKRALIGFRSDILDKRIEIIQELGNPEFTLKSVKSKIKELTETERRLNYAFLDTLIEISSVLDQKQWLKFLYNLSEDWFFSGMST